MKRRGFDVALRLLPASWRETVRADIEDEARASGRGAAWRVWHAVRVALKLRWALSGDTMVSDLHYAVRSLRHARWFTAGAVLTFALGIGINVAAFALADRVLFRALPFRDVSGLVLVSSYDVKSGQRYTMLSKSVAVDARLKADIIQDLGFAGLPDPYLFPASQEPPVWLIDASSNILQVLGVQPVLGRGFVQDDVVAGRPVALLRYEVWERRFGADTGVLGRVFSPSGGRRAGGNPRPPIEIVGVLPRGFVVPSVNWAAGGDGLVLSLESLDTALPRASLPGVFARLRPGASVAALQQEFDTLLAATSLDRPPDQRPQVIVQPLREGVFWRYHASLRLLFAGASLVWLLGCANLGTLMLARARTRETETAVRVALGASRARIVASALIESLLVCAGGAAVALVVLAGTLKSLSAVVPGFFQSMIVTRLDARVVFFTLMGATVGAVLSGIYPAWRTTRVNAQGVLQRGRTPGRGARGPAGRGLLVAQSAIGTVLVVAAALTVRSLAGLLTTDLGFNPSGLYAGYGVSSAAAPPAVLSPDERLARARQEVARLRLQPGVMTATSVASPIFSNEAPDRVRTEDGGRIIVRRILEDYFAVMFTRVVSGRTFSADEIGTAAPVVILSVSAAKQVWPDLEPNRAIGQTVRFADEPARQLVGVVADTRKTFGRPIEAEVFTPARAGDRLMAMVRARPGTRLDAAALRPAFEGSGGPGTGVAIIAATTALEPVLQDPRLYADVFGTFAVVALLLSAVGLFAVASGDVSLRLHEMGVRLTLGATAPQIQRLIVIEALRPVAIGVVCGAASAYAASAVIQSLLHDVSARDPWTYALVVVVLLATAVLASWWPARRAGQTDPAVVLRAQ